MNKDKFPGNSKTRSDKPVKPVTQAKVLKKNEPLLVRLFAGETARQIGSYVLWDVIVPAAKSTIQDIITNALDMALYNEPDKIGTRGRSVRRHRDRSYVSYSSISDDRRSARRSSQRHRGGRHNFDDITIESKTEAEEVLTILCEAIESYGSTSVADLFDAAGLESEFTDTKWGWYDLSRSSVRRSRYGYYLDLPKPEQLD